MTLPLFPDAAPAVPPDKITWERVPGPSDMNAYTMMRGGKLTGWSVRHCGHPTALQPYSVVHGADYYSGYRRLTEAQANAVRLMTAHRAGLPLVPHIEGVDQ